MGCLNAKVSELVISMEFPLIVLQSKKQYLEGMFLYHKREFNLFLNIFSVISSQEDEKLKGPLLLSVHTA